jgi:hypothetical protein
VTLPFRQHAVVTHARDHEVLGTIKLSTWQLREPRSAGKGVEYEWTGEAEIEAADLLVNQPNRRLYITDEPPAELGSGSGSGDWPPAGKRLTVIGAIRHDFLPHVELKLQEVRGS